MTDSQLKITGKFDQSQIKRRRDAVSALQTEIRRTLERWRETFGIDTPVAVDQAWGHANAALKSIQDDETFDAHLELAETHLGEAQWLINS